MPSVAITLASGDALAQLSHHEEMRQRAEESRHRNTDHDGQPGRDAVIVPQFCVDVGAGESDGAEREVQDARAPVDDHQALRCEGERARRRRRRSARTG